MQLKSLQATETATQAAANAPQSDSASAPASSAFRRHTLTRLLTHSIGRSPRWLCSGILGSLGSGWASLTLLLCIHTGCQEPLNSAPPGLVPVSGRVSLDGEPVARAKVVFLPQRLFAGGSQVQPAASALSDEHGNFNLQTAGQAGAYPGAYWVLFSKLDAPFFDEGEPDPAPDAGVQAAEAGPPSAGDAPPLEQVFPEFFHTASQLVFTVPDQGTTAARFELSIFDRPLKTPIR